MNRPSTDTSAAAALHEGQVLWRPDAARIARANVTALREWLAETRGLKLEDYHALWRWSVEDLEGFWGALWEWFNVEPSVPYTRVLGRREMPGAQWFPGARINYARHVLRRERLGGDALLFMNETQPLTGLPWERFGQQVRILATCLRELGVKPGDRVSAIMPNIPETIIAMLATTAIGAIWSVCSPDFGTRGALDRLAPLQPQVLICVDGYRYGGKAFDRREQMRDIASQIGSLRHLIWVPYLDPRADLPEVGSTRHWHELLARAPIPADQFRFEEVPFDHPLWTLFSSGTTGLPKAIVHGHGGILLETQKNGAFAFDLHAGDRLNFFTTTGWMLWNFNASTPLLGAVPVLYDGNPAYPGPDRLWQLAEQARVSHFGASPAYVEQLLKAGVVPSRQFDLSTLHTIVLAGSPATPECMAWFYRNVSPDLWISNGSGGTDVCSGFVGGVPTLPVTAGEIQAPSLGVSAKAFNDRGESVVGEVGELVITQPMPSMPLYFWNDPDNQRYRETYFDTWPGIWRHGDFFRIEADGRCRVLGRSDATLNRYGVRIGTAEIYRTLAQLDEIADSLIVNLDLPDGGFFMPLFVKLTPGHTLDAALEQKIRTRLRQDYTPRHVPDRIYQVPSIPMTLTGKKMEVPVRRLLLGAPIEKAANRAAMADPTALDFFIEYARRQRDYPMPAAQG